MHENNGWYSVHDVGHRPESGEEVLCLALIEYVKWEEDPLADPGSRIYYVATWYNAGDTLYDEAGESDDLEERIFGRKVVAKRDGFYIREPELLHRKSTKGGRLPKHSIIFRWNRLAYDTEGLDGLICWKHLDIPLAD